MKNIQKMMTTATLMMVLMVGTSFGGILVNGDAAPQQPCTAQNGSKGGVILSDVGILVNGLTGILVNGLTGILVNGVRTESPVDCGILVNG